MRNLFLPTLLLFSCIPLNAQSGIAQSGEAAVAPTAISADLGACSALITVTGTDSKPVYNAKVTTRIRYGFMGAKKLDLETFTGAAGQVKIAGLPEVPKKPIFIYITKDDKLETVEFKPDVHCIATFDVRLK
jgi:hypothetical protein